MIVAVLHRVPQRPTDRREIRIDLHEHRNVARGKDRTQYRAIVFNTFYCLEVALRVKSHRCTMFSFLLFKYVTDIWDLFKLSLNMIPQDLASNPYYEKVKELLSSLNSSLTQLESKTPGFTQDLLGAITQRIDKYVAEISFEKSPANNCWLISSLCILPTSETYRESFRDPGLKQTLGVSVGGGKESVPIPSEFSEVTKMLLTRWKTKLERQNDEKYFVE